MIICRLQGGLGNQMLQYACARSLSLLTKQPLRLDLSFLNDRSIPEITFRSYELGCFRLNASFAGKFDICRIIPPYHHTGNSFWRRKERSLYRFWQRISKKKIILENSAYVYEENVFSELDKTGYFMQGYFFSYRYFEQFRDIIISDFQPRSLSEPATEYLSMIKNANKSCSLHVRRGDYVTNKSANHFHGLCPIDFYKKAVELICQKEPETTFFCFSDDIEWCKQHLNELNVPIIFVEQKAGMHNFEDLILMSQCTHNIIANSTFSWWGGWLNQTPQKCVIAPRALATDPTVSVKDVYPPEWITL